jgi:hypothetical protein
MLNTSRTVASTPVYQRVSRTRTPLNTGYLFCRELVTLTPARMNESHRKALIDFAAKPLHIDLDQIGQGIISLVPDVLGYLRAADDGAPAHHQVLEK